MGRGSSVCGTGRLLMAIPFRDADELADIGAAAYLTIIPWSEGKGFEGALFLVNARGEPLEFTYNRVETPYGFLWRKDDIRRHAHRRLAASILSTCPVTPKLVLCLADEVASELFCEDIELPMPVGRIAPGGRVASFASDSVSPRCEVREATESPDPVNLFWFPAPPADSTSERQLVGELARRGLLLEPFDRAKGGLDEVYRDYEGA